MIGKKAVGTVEGYLRTFQIDGENTWYFRGKSLVISAKKEMSCKEKDMPKTILTLKAYVEDQWDDFMEKTGLRYP